MLGAGFGAVFQTDVPQIAYESDPEGNWDIFLLDLNTHLTHNLTRHPAVDTQPAWPEATGKIAFVSNRNKAWLTAIYEMDRYGREVRMLKSLPDPPASDFISRLGQRLSALGGIRPYADFQDAA